MTETAASKSNEKSLLAVASTGLTGLWMVGLFTGQDWWFAVLLAGYLVVLPMLAYWAGDDDASDWADADWMDGIWFGTNPFSSESTERDDETTDEFDETPLETLRRRYAEGDLTDAQFERKVESLLETETLEDVEDRSRRETAMEY